MKPQFMRQDSSVLLITPPLTQPNTPYPATPFLQGFFNTLGLRSHQMDLGLEVILHIFSREGMTQLFDAVENSTRRLSESEQRILSMRESYIDTIEPAIEFMQGRCGSLAHVIAAGDFLPEGGRFDELDDMEWVFGTMGIQDKARHFVTLYLEDITGLISSAIDNDFGFSRYAEKLGSYASSFDDIAQRMEQPLSFVDRIMLHLLAQKMESADPAVVGITIPFPGNLYSALRCGEYIKQRYPNCRIVMGGGFVSTELRSISDGRLFDYADYLTLDDGERPWQQLFEYWQGRAAKGDLVRTFIREEGEVVYYNNSAIEDISPLDVGTPDYNGLLLDKYLSVIEVTNPMHSLWSNGRWNKLMLAHGCYWGKCAFCDGSLDYIGRYKPNTASLLVDRMEQMIAATGERGFHFVDEAAPPALLRELSLEIIRRKISVTWWTNIRFEKSYTADLCTLLKRAGCLAVSGGLEVASDRLLRLINKGVTIEQVSKVANHFTQAGVMVHAYLMYGFPTQSAQETIDSLEVVRQLFEEGLIQSGFWHRFALTAHSPVGCNPERFSVTITEPPFGGFARNEIDFDSPMDDPTPFGEGLRRSLYNYMRGVGFDIKLNKWFDTPVPRTQLPPNYIARYLSQDIESERDLARRVVYWLGGVPKVKESLRMKRGKESLRMEFTFELRQSTLRFTTDKMSGEWLLSWLPRLSVYSFERVSYEELSQSYNTTFANTISLCRSQFWEAMREGGLILV